MNSQLYSASGGENPEYEVAEILSASIGCGKLAALEMRNSRKENVSEKKLVAGDNFYF